MKGERRIWEEQKERTGEALTGRSREKRKEGGRKRINK